MNALLTSVDQVAACANLRAVLIVDHGILPELAGPLARVVVAQPKWIARWHMLWSGSGLGPHTAMKVLHQCGLLGGDL